MKKTVLMILILSLLFSFSACKNNSTEIVVSGSEDNTSSSEAIINENDADMFTDRDNNSEYDVQDAVLIKLNGDSASCSSNAVKITGSTVTITDEGTYILEGTLNDGMIIVNAEENNKPRIVLSGVSVTSKESAALYILEADKVVVTLAEGTENSLVNGGTFTAIDESNIDAAVFSKQDITFNGTGALKVVSPLGHGIVSKDDLVITGGSYTVNAASHGIDANDSVRVSAATFDIDSGKDGIHVENSDDTSLGFIYISGGKFDIEAEGDGLSASAYANICGGEINIFAGGGSENGSSQSSDFYGGFMGGRPGQQNKTSSSNEDSTSMKGIKATGILKITDGSFTINSADDSIHSNSSVTIAGGTFEIASGDDGLHADEKLEITGGKINITECYEGLEALDVLVTGGDIKLIATDDGLNAAGGNDSSGMGGRDNGMFGGGMGGMHGMGGMSSSSNGSVVISGGTLNINSSGDGIDANGTLEITGGYTVVVGPTQGDTATLDYDKSAIISGGTFIGTGASGMAQSFSDSENQGVIAVSVGNQSSGTKITLKDSSGKEIISVTPELSFAVVILSSPDIEKGESYTISVGSISSEFKAS